MNGTVNFAQNWSSIHEDLPEWCVARLPIF